MVEGGCDRLSERHCARTIIEMREPVGDVPGRTPPDVFDVAERLLGWLGPMEPSDLFRLVYHTQACHVTWFGVPLFEAPIEAWGRGPVVRLLFHACAGQFIVHTVDGDAEALDPDARRVVDFVVFQYGPMRGSQLASVTFSYEPWREAFSRRSATEISLASMKRYHSQDVDLMDARRHWTGAAGPSGERHDETSFD